VYAYFKIICCLLYSAVRYWIYFYELFPLPDAPEVSLVLGRAMNSSILKEGDDVYFECQVKANPPPRRVIWKKEASQFFFLPDCSHALVWGGGICLLWSFGEIL
jgi:hypothetical protein